MILVFASASFEAAHSLPEHPKVHGHSYVVTVFAPEGGSAEQLRNRVEDICNVLDHEMLNDHLPEPTMENIARFVYRRIPDAKKITVERPTVRLGCEFTP